MTATNHYREGLGTATTFELDWERRRLSGALHGDDLDGLSDDVRKLLEGQLQAVEAERAERRGAGSPGRPPG
jgi:hypothetical protein